MAAKKKLAIIIISIIILASLGSVAAVYYGTNIISPLTPLGANQMALKVQSQSMEPTIKLGNYILVDKSINPSDLKNNDIIVFYRPGSSNNDFIVGRIVSMENVNGTLCFHTKGDFNSVENPWIITQNLIVGKVVNTNYK